MAANHDSEKDLPVTWPFTLAALIALLALAWFCLGFAIRDLPKPHTDLPSLFPVFFALLIAAGVIVVAAAAYNLTNESSRRKRLHSS